MADITKALWDDHARIRRMFETFSRGPTPGTAITICDELELHARLEEEIVYPALAEVNPALAESSTSDHQRMADLVAEIQELEADDPRLKRMMEKLQRTTVSHIQREERDVFPVLKTQLADRGLDMGREAFARRQELIAQLANKPSAGRLTWANTGWGPSRVANAGW